MRIRDAFQEYQFALLIHTEQTQIWYTSRLQQFLTWCEDASLHNGVELTLEDVTVAQLRRYIDYLSKRPVVARGKSGTLASSTVNGHARAIRAFLNWCSQEDVIGDSMPEKTPKKMQMPKIDEKVIEIFTSDQIKAMFLACDREALPTWAARDRAILSVLLDTGIRNDELCSLTLDNVHLKDPKDCYIKVDGKGRKEREVGLGRGAAKALSKYIHRYRKAAKSERSVFLSRFGKRFTTNGLDQMLSRLGDWAHVSGVRVSAHTFRHTYAVSYLKNGGDIFKLSRLLGHESVQTTMIYLKAFNARDARDGGKSVLDNL